MTVDATSAGPVQLITDLDLPVLKTEGLDRLAALEIAISLSREHWIAKTDMGYSVLHAADAEAILRDRRFHSALAAISRLSNVETDETTASRRRSILTAEGDEHTRLRRLVSPAFTPASADRHRPVMRQVFSELLDPVLAAGRAEFVNDVCEPYPIPIICEVLGAPKGDWKMFSEWATNIFKIFNGNLEADQADIQRASEELRTYMLALIAERRESRRDDLLSDLIAAEEDGDRLTTDELCMLADAVLMAGTDTTRNQLGCAVALFAQHPAEWARLRDNPDLAPRAVEECMRYLGAVRQTSRIASTDIDYRGVRFPEGTFVSTHLAAGNRDPERFTEPDEFDVAMERDAQQLTFGSGIHRCLGAALARAELQEAFRVLAERVRTIELDGEITWKPSSFGIWGPATLPITITAA